MSRAGGAGSLTKASGLGAENEGAANCRTSSSKRSSNLANILTLCVAAGLLNPMPLPAKTNIDRWYQQIIQRGSSCNFSALVSLPWRKRFRAGGLWP